jgi:hypothetical protein
LDTTKQIKMYQDTFNIVRSHLASALGYLELGEPAKAKKQAERAWDQLTKLTNEEKAANESAAQSNQVVD